MKIVGKLLDGRNVVGYAVSNGTEVKNLNVDQVIQLVKDKKIEKVKYLSNRNAITGSEGFELKKLPSKQLKVKDVPVQKTVVIDKNVVDKNRLDAIKLKIRALKVDYDKIGVEKGLLNNSMLLLLHSLYGVDDLNKVEGSVDKLESLIQSIDKGLKEPVKVLDFSDMPIDIAMTNIISAKSLQDRVLNLKDAVKSELPYSPNGIYLCINDISLGNGCFDTNYKKDTTYGHLYDTFDEQSQEGFRESELGTLFDVTIYFKDLNSKQYFIEKGVVNAQCFNRLNCSLTDDKLHYTFNFTCDMLENVDCFKLYNIPFFILKDGVTIKTHYNDVKLNGVLLPKNYKFNTEVTFNTITNKVKDFGHLPYVTYGSLYQLLCDGITSSKGCKIGKEGYTTYTYTDLIGWLLDLTELKMLHWLNVDGKELDKQISSGC